MNKTLILQLNNQLYKYFNINDVNEGRKTVIIIFHKRFMLEIEVETKIN